MVSAWPQLSFEKLSPVQSASLLSSAHLGGSGKSSSYLRPCLTRNLVATHGSSALNTIFCHWPVTARRSSNAVCEAHIFPREDISQNTVRSIRIAGRSTASSPAKAGKSLPDVNAHVALALEEPSSLSASPSRMDGRNVLCSASCPMRQAARARSAIRKLSDLPRR